jgi:hypothetical protein
MRRKLAYILLSSAIIVSSAALFGSTLVSMDTDVTYGSGKELVFKISEKNTTYGGVSAGNYISNDEYAAVNAVADEMVSRLKTWGANGEVSKEGYDTIRVKIRAQENDDTEYRYIENYLAFSGKHISVAASEDTLEDYKPVDSYSTMFDDQTARIEYVNNIPVVVVGVNEPKKDGVFDKLLDYCKSHTKEANSSEGTKGESCYLCLWANKQEGDTYAKATATGDTADTNISSRLIFAENYQNAWYDNTDDDYDYTEFQLLPNSSALSDKGFDSSKAGAAYKAAFFYMNLFNASDYAALGVGYDVTFAFAKVITSSVDNLVVAGDWNLMPGFGATMIATLVAFALCALVLAFFYHFGALSVLSGVSFTLIGSLLLLSYFNAQFGIGTLVGLLLSALVAGFGPIYYLSKLREELYKGRTLKKSHSEAIRRSVWPVIDAGVLAIILGLCVYAWVPATVGQLGLVLVFGGFFSLVHNLLLLRLEGYLLANDSSAETKLGKTYNIDETKLLAQPDLAAAPAESASGETKKAYEGPYADKNFKKPFKGVAIAMGALLVASIAGLTVFSVLKGTAYNYADAYNDTTVGYIEYRVVSSNTTNLRISDVEDVETSILPMISLDGNKLDSTSYTSVDKETSTVYLTETEISYSVNYYVINFASYYDPNATYAFTVTKLDGSTEEATSLGDALTLAVDNYVGEAATASVKNVAGATGTPTLPTVWLGLGIGLLLDLVYLVIRYRPSRGLVLGLFSYAVPTIVMGFFALTRIPVTPFVSAGAIGGAFLTMLFAFFVLAKEKEIFKESRERDKDSLAFHSECLNKAVSTSAGDLVIFALLALWCGVSYFCLAPATFEWVYAALLLAILAALALILFVLAPASIYLATLFSKINISFKRPDKKEQPGAKKKSPEPEEAIFIGIND